MAVSADLAHELGRRRVNFLLRGGRFKFVKRLDVPAHA
jgi:hypothetical protein